MLSNIWEIYVNLIGTLFLAIVETAMFAAQFGLFGIAMVFLFVMSCLLSIAILATR
jgi:hypothetical protein